MVQAIADSGATVHLTGDLSHVKSFTGRSKRLRVADCLLAEPAYECVFRDNSLELSTGCFHSQVSAFLISTNQNAAEGGAFAQDKNTDTFTTTKGVRYLLNKNSQNLPVINIEFFKNTLENAPFQSLGLNSKHRDFDPNDFDLNRGRSANSKNANLNSKNANAGVKLAMLTPVLLAAQLMEPSGSR